MGKDTAIAWTHHTFNPWWGCVKVAPECEHCYAETFAKRTGHKVFGPGAGRRFFTEAHWREPEKWDRAAAKAGERRRVFCGSMCDVFDPEVNESWRMKLWGLIERTPHLDWLLLTKRPEFAATCIPSRWGEIRDRVWLGTTAGCQPTANENLGHLIALDAAVLFVSAEPLIAPMTIPEFALGWIDWVIVGGESGPGARSMNPDWARDLRDLAQRIGAAFFMKQMGAVWAREQGNPGFYDVKGDAMERWPEDLRIREYPRARSREG